MITKDMSDSNTGSIFATKEIEANRIMVNDPSFIGFIKDFIKTHSRWARFDSVIITNGKGEELFEIRPLKKED